MKGHVCLYIYIYIYNSFYFIHLCVLVRVEGVCVCDGIVISTYFVHESRD